MNDKTQYSQKDDYEFFVEQLPDLLEQHRGRIALIRKHKVIKLYDSMETAVLAGAKKFGPAQFIAQEITDDEPLPVSYAMAY